MPLSSTNDFEQRLERIPRVGLAHLPTPLEPLPRLTARLGGPQLWVKREDCSGLGFGGNKVRKLDYVLSGALDQGAEILVTGGVVQSNSQRQVAAAAAKLGLACHLVVYEGRVPPPSPDNYLSGNALLNRLFGAEIKTVPWTGDRNAAIEAHSDELRAQGRKPFVVPYGASSARGALAYASTTVEIAGQSAKAGFTPSAIVHCSGSGGTQAGLVLGAQTMLPKTRVIGIDIDAEPDRVRADVLRYGRDAAALLGIPFHPADVEVVAGHAGPAYGVPHAATLEAIKLAARFEALILDPVYSGKGLAGLISLIGEGRFGADEDVIFLHSGGEPAIFAYREMLELLPT